VCNIAGNDWSVAFLAPRGFHVFYYFLQKFKIGSFFITPRLTETSFHLLLKLTSLFADGTENVTFSFPQRKKFS